METNGRIEGFAVGTVTTGEGSSFVLATDGAIGCMWVGTGRWGCRWVREAVRANKVLEGLLSKLGD